MKTALLALNSYVHYLLGHSVLEISPTDRYLHSVLAYRYVLSIILSVIIQITKTLKGNKLLGLTPPCSPFTLEHIDGLPPHTDPISRSEHHGRDE